MMYSCFSVEFSTHLSKSLFIKNILSVVICSFQRHVSNVPLMNLFLMCSRYMIKLHTESFTFYFILLFM